MNTLHIEASEKTLEILCNKGCIDIKGCSILSNPEFFFTPLFKWLEAYIKNPDKKTIVNCRFEYIDTASFKHLYKFFKKLEDIKLDYLVEINWYYDINDPEILELGELLENRVRFKVQFISS